VSLKQYYSPSRVANPKNAVSHFRKGGKTPNMTPALLWLWVLLIGASCVRSGQLPSQDQFITWFVVAGVVVAAGAFFPAEVALALLALVVAAVLNVYQPLTTKFNEWTGKIAALVPGKVV